MFVIGKLFQFNDARMGHLIIQSIYRESEDTLLFIMKEIYTSLGVQTDSQIPQHTMTIERPSPSLTPNTDCDCNDSASTSNRRR